MRRILRGKRVPARFLLPATSEFVKLRPQRLRPLSQRRPVNRALKRSKRVRDPIIRRAMILPVQRMLTDRRRQRLNLVRHRSPRRRHDAVSSPVPLTIWHHPRATPEPRRPLNPHQSGHHQRRPRTNRPRPRRHHRPKRPDDHPSHPPSHRGNPQRPKSPRPNQSRSPRPSLLRQPRLQRRPNRLHGKTPPCVPGSLREYNFRSPHISRNATVTVVGPWTTLRYKCLQFVTNVAVTS